ncbi:hypothetical protein [Peptoniphilus stercorisuis]|uniref:Uncharacterized protein n=1 Tax=Peptoniphilus stercorisuis TaxID=1436965 RepID=A0ABS4KDG1_9FIRM|nr:hypothetical protein [Peptoniphilus stercorisuis]MBP2025201.1 hypothetical protein [Peptoniphilus stercorisuis]
MKRLNNKIYILTIIISIALISVFSYYSFLNISKNQSVNTLYKNQNKVLKEKIIKIDENINSSKSKLEVIDKKEEEILEKIKYYENVNIDLSKYSNDYNRGLVNSIKGNLDLDRKNSIKDKSIRYRKLRSVYFSDDEVASKSEAINNITINSLILNDYLYTILNTKIVKNNNEVFKNIGVLNQIEENNNYMIKDTLYKFLSKEENLKNKNLLFEETKNIIKLKEESILAYDNLLYPSEYNYNYLNQTKNNLEIEKNNIAYNDKFKLNDDTLVNIKKINKQELFNIDVISQNIDYLNSLDILDKTLEEESGVQVLRYLVDHRNRLYLIEERLDGSPMTLNYYNPQGNAFSQIDMNNFKIYYFYDKSNKENLNLYNYSMKLYKTYKRD